MKMVLRYHNNMGDAGWYRGVFAVKSRLINVITAPVDQFTRCDGQILVDD